MDLRSGRSKAEATPRQPHMKLRSGRFKAEAAPRQSSMSPGIPQTRPLTKNITNSNLSSRLLQLPQELKTQIYGYLLGGQCLHVVSTGYSGLPNPFSLWQCFAKATTSSAQRAFDTATDFDAVYRVADGAKANTDDEMESSNFISIDPHRRCYGRFHIARGITTSREAIRSSYRNSMPRLSTRCGDRWRTETMHLPVHILRTCRQIYHEANHIIYLTNTFSFENSRALEDFVSHLNSVASPSKALAIRHLHLHMVVLNKYNEIDWNRALHVVARGLSNLRSVDVSIDQAIWNHKKTDETVDRRKTPTMSKRNNLLVAMSAFKELKFLREMTLVVTDVYPPEAWAPSDFLWSNAEKQRWVRDVRADILGRGKGLGNV